MELAVSNSAGRSNAYYPSSNELLLEDGKYIGDIKNNKPKLGILIYKEGNAKGRVKYEGEFDFERPNGKGMMVYTDGRKYVGSFTNDKCHGGGKMMYSYGDIEKDEGIFVDGQFHDGNRKYKSGASYDGNFVNNVPHGHGKFEVKIEEVVRISEGEFKDGLLWNGTLTLIRNGFANYITYENGEERKESGCCKKCIII